MAIFLFIDESGQDHKDSPYEVLAGISIQDSDLWNLIRVAHDLEIECFRGRYRNREREIKARNFLNRKTFRFAEQLPPIHEAERAKLARKALDNGRSPTKKQLTALAQAKIDYVYKVLQLCKAFNCKIFASVVINKTPFNVNKKLLRKDYVYLFERFYYHLENTDGAQQGILVFDELEKSNSHILVSQVDRYFKKTTKGMLRSNLIIPEPFFVHSDLSTGIQFVDLIAYVISWNLKLSDKLAHLLRPELDQYWDLIKSMRFKTERVVNDKEVTIWGITMV